ncbi:MAG: magnesium transporter, partial [Pseudomonadota bacterium]
MMAEDQSPEGEPEDAYALNAQTVDAILAAIEVGARDRLVTYLEPFHPADIADLLEQIGPTERVRLVKLWGVDLDAEVLSELEDGVREQILAVLSEEQLAAAVNELETDDVVYLVEDLEEPEQERVLDALEDSDRAAVEQLLQYPEGSAGRMMQRHVVSAPTHWSVGDVIDYMRASDDLPEQFYDIVIVDPAHL